jgi:serine/threonine-protein kinase RsbW
VPGRSEALEQTGPAAGTDDLVLDIPADPEHARTARLFAAAVARHFEVDEERVEDLKVAISEACTNAMHAHRAAAVDDSIRIVARPEAGRVVFDVVDAGAGFDPVEAMSTAMDYTPPAGLFEGSLGLVLIRSLFPGMQIARNPDRGMTVSIPVER